MRESDIRRRIVEALRPLDAQAVENPINPGTPDVEFIGGWVEIKYIREWPKRADTPLRIHHFTAQQRLWISERRKRGGKVLIVVRVAKDLLLFESTWCMALGTLTKAQMFEACSASWGNFFDNSMFLECVKQLTND